MWRPSRLVWAAGPDTQVKLRHPGLMHPTSRRQITACTDPATHVHRRQKARGLLYEVAFCKRHRWAVEGWGKTLRPVDEPRPCGAVDDYRTPHEIVLSHFRWFSSIAPSAEPPQSPDEWGGALRAAHADAASLGGDGSVIAALDRAARTAEAGASPLTVLAALADAETAAVVARHW